jgi:RHS repeat-associated protein
LGDPLYDFRGGPRSSGYFRDAETGLDYAINRYHQPGMGRFLTPDKKRRSARLGSPGSWNRYAYAQGDPINRKDPKGLSDVVVGGVNMTPQSSSAMQSFAQSSGGMQVYPYASSSGVSNPDGSWNLSMIGGLLGGMMSVAYQAFIGANQATQAAEVGILSAYQDAITSGQTTINICAYSGGAQATSLATAILPSSITSMVNNITYISPGEVSGLATGSGQTSVIQSSGADSVLFPLWLNPGQYNAYSISCGNGHDPNCAFGNYSGSISQFGGSACSDPFTISTSAAGIEVVSSTINYGGGTSDQDDDDDDDDEDDEAADMAALPINVKPASPGTLAKLPVGTETQKFNPAFPAIANRPSSEESRQKR